MQITLFFGTPCRAPDRAKKLVKISKKMRLKNQKLKVSVISLSYYFGYPNAIFGVLTCQDLTRIITKA